MTINFECGNCGKQLATPDDKAGKTGKCPDCGEPVSVPRPQSEYQAEDPFDFGEIASSLPPIATGRSMRSCPMCGAQVSSTDQSCPACGEELKTETAGKPSGQFSTGNRVDIGEVFSMGWQRFQEQMGTVIAAVLIAGFANAGINMVMQLALSGLNDPVVGVFLLQIVSFLFNTWIYLGVFKLALSVARGERVEVSEVFTGGKFFLRGLAINILNPLILLVTVGPFAALCVWLAVNDSEPFALILGIPTVIWGIYVGMSLLWAMYVLIDTDSTPISCLKMSWDMMQGNYIAVFVLNFLGAVLIMLGFLMCCVGALFTAPLVVIIQAVTYDHLSGGADRRPGDRF